MPKRRVLILGGAATLLAACVIREVPPEQPIMTPAAAPNVPPPNAIDSIATARCDLALRCNRIGPYSEFMNYEHCMNLMRGQTQVRECPRGVDPRALDRCLADIAVEGCARASFGGVDRFNACSEGSLCYP